MWNFMNPDHLKTQEMCNKAVDLNPRALIHVPDRFITQEMCDDAVDSWGYAILNVPDRFKTQEICNKAVDENHSSFDTTCS